MKTEEILTAETARRAKLAEAARKRPRVKGRFVASEHSTVLNAEEFARFAAALDRPPNPPQALIDLMHINAPWEAPQAPPMRHETNGIFGLHTDNDAPRPWRLTAAWVLLGVVIGWLACVVVGGW